MALRMVDDAGVLACGAVVLALVLRLLVGYARRSQRRPVAATADNDAEGLSEPLLSEQPQPPQREPVYVLRSPVFRWLREACAILLGAAYVVRAYTLFYHGEVAVAGTRLVLIAIGWWLLAQVEEGPGLTGPMPAPAPESHAWLTLTLGYLFYLVLAIHPLLVKAEGSTAVVVVVGQLCVAALAMALLALEGVVALAESRRRQPQPQPQPQQGRSVLFKTLHVPPTPEQTASFLSTITFGWMNPIIATGKRKVLAAEDLYHLEQHDRSAYVWQRFKPHAAAMEREHREHPRTKFMGGRLFRALFRTWPGMFVAVSAFQLVTSLAQFGIPVALRYLVDFIKDYQRGSPVPPTAYAMAATLFVAPALAAVANVQQFRFARRLIFRWRAACIALVFRQTLRLDPSVASYSSGQVVNLCSVDASNVDAIRYFPFLWSIPLEVSISIALIFWVLRSWISGLVGVVLVALSVYVTVRLSERLRAAQKQLMRRKDARLSLLGEALHGVRILKLLAWERDFLKKLDTARAAEVLSLRAFILSRCLVSILWVSAPILVSVLTFLLHVKVLKRDLSASQGYTTLALFGILREPLSSLSTYVNTWIKVQVSLGRLERFFLEAPLLQRYQARLLTEEEEDEGHGDKAVAVDGDDDRTHIVIDMAQSPQRRQQEQQEQECVARGEVVIQSDAGFAWGGEQSSPLLTGIHLHARPGELICIYGATGAGKSSLLMALLGEMRAAAAAAATTAFASSGPGPVLCGGSVSYASQRPWILHGTVRDNILFGAPMEPARYEAALEACDLRADLEGWEGGDLTEMGEKGVQCSGGQQQRLSLCRAVYARSDVVLLDDVLSAVDAHVAKHILTQCLTGPLLRGRTVILVTHQVALTLPAADQIVVIGAEGRVLLQGRPNEAAGSRSPEMAAFVAQHALAPGSMAEGNGGGEAEEDGEAAADAATLIRKKGEGTRVVAAEQKAEGRIKLRVYSAYIAAAGGPLLVSLALSTFAGAEALNFFQNKALGAWVDRLEGGDGSNGGSNGVAPYLSFSAASIIVLVVQSLLAAFCSLLASRRIHHKMAHRVLRAPMVWFETTPVGRIQNRFSSDMDTIDTDMMETSTKFISRLAAILTITAVIVSAMPPLVLGMLPILLASAYVGWAYQKSAQELKRLDSVTRSPIYSHFAESVAGLATIRAFQQQRAFVRESGRRVDANDRVYHHLWCANRWLALRLQLLGSTITGMVGAYIMATLGHIPGPTAGLVLLFCMNFSDNANTLIRQQAQLEMDANSVERTVIEYTQELVQEAATIVPAHRPASTWPASGELVVQNLWLRYPGTETDVLCGLSFHIPPRTRVGVVGRTGAGKTSLMAALFRLVEPTTGSSIRVDGEDVLQMGLEDLRSRLAIVPQESILFAGTVRTNLDPFGEYDDVALWRALEKAQLCGRVVKSLDDPVNEGGSNFSQGERALLCMSRALLRMRGLLVLDECTANVDPQTDAAIQAMVRSELDGCGSVLTVAHRLKTVAYYDKVLVMDRGRIVEDGTPLELLKTQGGVFRELAMQTGEFDALIALAWDAAREKEGRKRASLGGDKVDMGSSEDEMKDAADVAVRLTV